MGHGVLGTASTPFLEQTLGGLDHTRREGVFSPGPNFSQDIHIT